MRSSGNYKQPWQRNGVVALDYCREIPFPPGSVQEDVEKLDMDGGAASAGVRKRMLDDLLALP